MGREAVAVHGANSIYRHPMEFRRLFWGAAGRNLENHRNRIFTRVLTEKPAGLLLR